jgi:LysM repeat protein
MKINRSFFILIAVLVVISLGACVRPIPGSEETTPTTDVQVDEPEPGSTDVLDQIYLFATQTAVATMGGQQTTAESPAQETPQAPAETEVPYPIDTSQATAAPTQPEAAVPPPNVPVPTFEVPNSYTLKGGEFPYCIARRFNVNPGELLRLNGLSNFSVYYAGMTLRIPQTGRPFPGNRSLRPHPATYTIRAGDTIFKIACTFGNVYPEAIAQVNGLTPPYKLTPGQTINIP